MMDHEAMIEVIQAHKDGKQIQFTETGDERWTDYALGCDPTWNFGAYDYRIKPEKKKPQEVWVITNTKTGAFRVAPRGGAVYVLTEEKAKLFREVLE